MGGRLNGNLKKKEKYDPETPVNVYTTTKFNKKIRKMRYISENLAKMAYDKDKNNPSFITKTEYKELKRRCDANSEKEPTIEKFKTQEEVKRYFDEHKERLGGGTGPREKKPRADGKFEANLNRSGGMCVASCDQIYDIRKHGLNETTHRYYVHACYEDINDISTLQFWFIHH